MSFPMAAVVLLLLGKLLFWALARNIELARLRVRNHKAMFIRMEGQMNWPFCQCRWQVGEPGSLQQSLQAPLQLLRPPPAHP